MISVCLSLSLSLWGNSAQFHSQTLRALVSDRLLKVRSQINKQDEFQTSQEDAGCCSRLLELFAEMWMMFCLQGGLRLSTRNLQDFPSPLRVIKIQGAIRTVGNGWMDGWVLFAEILMMVSVCRAMAIHSEPPKIKQGELPTEEDG
jgi:hypothetical protein